MPNFCMTLMNARICRVQDGQWNDGGQVVAVGGAGYEGK